EWGPASNDSRSRRYGGLCHAVPVMIRTCGLCQAVAFLYSKAMQSSGDEKLLEHIAGIAGVDRSKLDQWVAGLPTSEYMLNTLRILDAMVFYKRFAVSVLKAEAADADEGAADHASGAA
ncbi:MAG TPA: type III-B CRISPR module-associated protein Cmr5, partial [Armatimonadota bacterium]|nr:type III-B CRISPR module-associated protein Cmr5 [Armatimonadota bacterium]